MTQTPSPLNEGEFTAYAQRAEARFAADTRPHVQRLYTTYLTLKRRFARDLGTGRDYHVSCAAALMLIQHAADAAGAASDRDASSG